MEMKKFTYNERGYKVIGSPDLKNPRTLITYVFVIEGQRKGNHRAGYYKVLPRGGKKEKEVLEHFFSSK